MDCARVTEQGEEEIAVGEAEGRGGGITESSPIGQLKPKPIKACVIVPAV